ncbi:nicotinate-nucleotide adenylyltransferase [Lachnobacterium bovis]|jgi:nicotinate-nucleotide adenylyltransferase|uniref:Probable nicotinate-nucleotide adenylyltransferase n=1 Tax=Lachnobacterium bovis DSM 14045 TaxID=1122142 RepID=A0A1H3FKS9_9FIRM|nr:nicotinate-nucleotide adenylyltransferase [Lachnobacterium bovis]MBQ1801624.1 nicotinate-nucleotide adenylyltransferase [Lachnobacterium sp.]SDX91387.1 nicotinate-nucleotide adenylyltransferase [Lachnobacterium bovis DSM 14045]
MRIGILGGSFDPIHNGHVYMAKMAKEKCKLDKVIIVPAGHSPNKDESKMVTGDDRSTMCKYAVENINGIEISDIEVLSDSRSYTYITIKNMYDKYPQDELFFIMGADSIDYFEKWKNPEIIAKYSDIIVINRDEYTNEYLEKKIEYLNTIFPVNVFVVECPKIDISSTTIRSLFMNKEYEEAKKFLNDKVFEYIINQNLY